jgi:hypothetical protein
MEWVYVKYLREIEIGRITDRLSTSCEMWLPPSYPIQLMEKHQFEGLSEFHQHPNTSSSM